ncbi:hypothetical protein [Arsenicicoccus dermatophilus]|uniref:hypothetical protein n=1 Tax=Arsenicicoccus dermatophilus TaxID=1076331 RepID=UPI003916CEB3
MSSAPWWADDADAASPGRHVEVLRPHVELHVPEAEPEGGTTRGVVVGAGVLTTAVLLTGILGTVTARDQMSQLQAAGAPARSIAAVPPTDLGGEPTAALAGGRELTSAPADPAPADLPHVAAPRSTVVVAPSRPVGARPAPGPRTSDHAGRRPATSGSKAPRPRPSAATDPSGETDGPPVIALTGPVSSRPRHTPRPTTAARPRSAPAKDGDRRKAGATRPAASPPAGRTRR